MSAKIEHTTLAEKAYEQLRSGLISARFGPGEVLRIRSLAAEYGISATPVREALQRLVAENALEMQPNKSFRVPVLTIDRFEEVRRIRCALESMAAELAYPNFSKKDVEALDALAEKMDRAIESTNVESYTLNNEKFHFLIYRKSASPLLLDMIRDLWIQAAPFFTSLFEESEYLSRGNACHKKIVRAFKRGDVSGIMDGIASDIDTAGNHLRKKLELQEMEEGMQLHS